MRRWFLSYHSPDQALAEQLKSSIEHRDPDSRVFFAPNHLRAGGSWSSQLAAEIAQATAFILLVGENGLGPWQVLEYDEALDKRVTSADFPIVLILLKGQAAPGLPFLRRLHWIITADPTSEVDLARLIDATSGGASPTREQLWRHTSPYRGLSAMTEMDTDYFFGRDRETVEVLKALAAEAGRLPVLLGNSGVGKSSLAQAGVLGALKRQAWPERIEATDPIPFPFQDSRRWCFLSMKPGSEPIKELIEPFLQTWQLDSTQTVWGERRSEWIDKLLNGKSTLSDLLDATERRYAKLSQPKPPAFFLYVDQGEELYVRSGERQRRRFSELLAQGLTDPRLVALMSLRADFLGELQSDELLYSVHYKIDVTPLREAELREVVSRPATLLSARFEADGLATDLARRTAEESVKDAGALPLLSYLLDDMWTQMVRRGDGVLRLPAQAVELGGVLVERADAFLARHPKARDQLRRILTLKLATVREDGEPTRRRALRSEFSDEEWRLVTELADHPHRLLVTATPEGSETYAEAAHEAIFRRWEILREWIAAEHEFLIWKSQLENDRRRWEGAPEQSRSDALLMGLALAQAQNWMANRPEELPRVDREFINLSLKREAREREQREKFRNGALLMHSRLLADQAHRSTSIGDACTGMLLALEALPDARGGIERPYSGEAELALFSGNQRRREIVILKGHDGAVTKAAFSVDERRVVTASADKTARIWDLETGKEIAVFRGHEGAVTAASHSPDGRRVVTASDDKTIRIWDIVGNEIAVLKGHDGSVTSLAFSPDGRRVVTASADKTARVWDIEAGEEIAVFRGHDKWTYSAAFSPDGLRVVTASDDKTVRLWEAKTGKEIVVFRGHDDGVWSAAFSPDGRRVVSASFDSTARLWEVQTGLEIVLRGHEGPATKAAFTPNGQRVVTASDDKTARLWDVETGREVAVLRGHESPVTNAAISPDGRHVLTASADKTARLWEIDTGEEIAVLRGHDNWISSAVFSPDGQRVLTASDDKTARLWKVETEKEIAVFRGHDDGVRSVAYSPSGQRIVTASQDKTARLWEMEQDKEGATLKGHDGSVQNAAFSPDGRRVVTASWDSTARLWDLETGKEIVVIKEKIGPVQSAGFSPDGRRVVTTSGDRTARLWEMETGKEIAVCKGHDGPVQSATFSPDGQRVVTASDDKTVRLWDAETGKQIAVLRAHGRGVRGAAFSPDGRRVVTASADKTARIWDVEMGQEIVVLRGHDAAVTSAAFSPDGRRAVTTSLDKTARLWDVETSKQIAVLTGHTDAVWSAAFSPDGRHLVTASDDKTIRLWQVFTTTQRLVDYAKNVIPRCLTRERREQAFLDIEPPAWSVEMEKWPYHTAEWKQWLADKAAGKSPPLPSSG
jgi:WD40 repeat protein